MAKPLEQLEGTWEEILARAPELAGHRLRVEILDAVEEAAKTEETPGKNGRSTLGALAEAAPGWAGDDFEECLEAVYDNRLKARF